MTDEVFDRLNEAAPMLEREDAESERLGRLTDVSAKLLRESGCMRLTQSARNGGYEAHPSDFYRAVMMNGSRSGSAGWVTGVVGVHAFEMSLADPVLQDEVWGADRDTWIASPYAPFGVARPVTGGYLFNGRWPFSSGTDHCQWVMIGGRLADEDGNVDNSPAGIRNFALPRGDYEIVEGSWETMGLAGTGSKDLIVTDQFVPEYRVLDPQLQRQGYSGRERGLSNPLYDMPRGSIFSAAITAGTIGAALGVLRAFEAYTSVRVTAREGSQASADPYILRAFAEASADIEASRIQFFADIERLYDHVAAHKPVTTELRLEIKRNLTRSSVRVAMAADQLFESAGGNSIRRSSPIQRYWRDVRAALNHHSHAPVHYYHYGLAHFGHPLPDGLNV